MRRIIVYDGDNASIIAQRFAEKYNLSESKAKKLEA